MNDQPPSIDLALKELDYVRRRRSAGHIVEFDYPYHPKVRSWTDVAGDSPCGKLISKNYIKYKELLSSFLSHLEQFGNIPTASSSEGAEPFWSNGWLPSLDAICISGLVTKLNPQRYVEIGSGNSTKFVRRAIKDFGLRTKIISIDPYPRAVIDTLCDEVIRQGIEDVALDLFADLGSQDMLFVDNSHRSFQNSDVTVFFTEILPRLQSGCLYGVHDIFLPYDYPAEWMERFYNEQYLLMAYLLGGAGGDEIVMPVHFVEQTPQLLSILGPLFDTVALRGVSANGGAFWMRKA